MDSFDFQSSKLKTLFSKICYFFSFLPIPFVIIISVFIQHVFVIIDITGKFCHRVRWQIRKQDQRKEEFHLVRTRTSEYQNNGLNLHSTKIHAMTFSCHFRIQMLNFSKTVIFHELRRIDTHQIRYGTDHMAHI